MDKNRKQELEILKNLRPMDDVFMRCIFKNNIPLVEHVVRAFTRNQSFENCIS